jgi:hypothetical protein
MADYKRITADAIPRALAKAERYRLLNEPEEAESICEDILHIDSDNQQALVMMTLALTDSFQKNVARVHQRAHSILSRLRDPYEHAYYEGIISERWAKAQYDPQRHNPFVYNGLREAMSFYEQAQALSPAGNDDAVLRLNACVRFIENNQIVKPSSEEQELPYFGDDSPPV